MIVSVLVLSSKKSSPSLSNWPRVGLYWDVCGRVCFLCALLDAFLCGSGASVLS